MNIGFTGTQLGMTQKQQEELQNILIELGEIRGDHSGSGVFNHGDCIGADFEAATIAKDMKYYIIGHPPQNPIKRAYFKSHEEMSPFPYLVRNHNIVDATDFLIVAPKEYSEQVRSGTWATYRYAKKLNKRITVIYPDGVLEHY